LNSLSQIHETLESLVSNAQEEPQPAILSALYGYNDCIGGVNNFETQQEYLQELLRRNCSVVTEPRSGSIATNVAPAQNMAGACGGADISWKDGMPVVFNFPIVGVTTSMAPDTLAVELSDGSVVTPDCILLPPANEANELDTALVIGELGDGYGGSLYPVKLTVVGELKLQGPDGELDAQGLTFSNPGDMEYLGSSVRMVYARLWDVEDFSEGDINPEPSAFYPNNCESLFPSTSHVIRVAFSGGFTLDGVTAVEPSNRQLFSVSDRVTGTTQLLG